MKFRSIICLFTLLSLHVICSANSADSIQYAQEREVYQQALLAIQKNDVGKYKQARHLLRDYPLVTYLDYEYLYRNFDQLPEKRIARFLKKHEGSYIAKKMQVSWLNYLGYNKQWTLLNKFYKPELATDTNQCFSLQAELALTNDKDRVYQKVGQHWLKSYSLPDVCNSLFANWKNLGYQTPDHIWKRFQLAYNDNNLQLAKYLYRSLKPEHSKVAKRLLRATHYMDYWIGSLEKSNSNVVLESKTLKRLLRTLSNKDHQKVALLIQTHQLPLEKEDLIEVQKLSAWYVAKTSGTKAQQWITKYTDSEHPEFYDYQLRYALQDKNWSIYQDVFKGAPEEKQNKQEWLYWYAIAQQNTGIIDQNQHLAPDTILTQLAEERSFYGILAAEKKDQAIFPKVMFSTKDIKISKAVQKKLAPAIELYHSKKTLQANREWYYTTKTFTADEWKQAGVLAHNTQWHERTIQAYAKAQYWEATEHRFPLAYYEHISKNSKKQLIDQGWLFAMARQESGFSPTARSPVGALGILQLMPSTAKKVARRMKLRYSAKKLLDPAYNIALGSKYLKELLTKYNNNYVLATAAYNAGPHRINEWLSLRPITDDWGHWVATIPYKETRKYVQNIMTYSKIYAAKLSNNRLAQVDTLQKPTTFIR